jgi:hypothetical protein
LQFLDLAQTGIIKPLLFATCGTPSADRIGQVVDSAVDMFLAAYSAPASKRRAAKRPSTAKAAR